MPRSEIKSVTVSHIYDDDSVDDFKIEKGEFEATGKYVSLNDGDQTIYLRPESWPEIREQIQSFFDDAPTITK